jgi:hypothetical protein
MRQSELSDGVDLRDENGEKACKSKHAAQNGITQARKAELRISRDY